MKKILVCLCLCLAASTAMAISIRVSALIDTGSGIKVGIINNHTGNSFLLAENEEVEGVRLISADYDTERICIQAEGTEYWFNLQGDPVARSEAEERAKRRDFLATLPGDLGETINQLMAENPNAKMRMFETPFISPETNAVTGLGAGIETLLKEQGQDPSVLPTNITGRGETIEKLMNELSAPEPVPDDAYSQQYGEGIGKHFREGSITILEGAIDKQNVDGTEPNKIN